MVQAIADYARQASEGDQEGVVFPALLEEGRTGLLVPARDPDALADALRRVTADADWRARAGEVGRARVARDYSIQSRARRIEDMITDLVARAAERPAR